MGFQRALTTRITFSCFKEENDVTEYRHVVPDIDPWPTEEGFRILRTNELSIDWNQFDVFYLFNPFQEQICRSEDTEPIDRRIQLSRKTFEKYVSEVFRQLELLKPKKTVITFHGYGGKFPSSLKLRESFHIENGVLNIWEKM